MNYKKYVVIGGRGYIGASLFSSIPEGVIGLRTASDTQEGFFSFRLEDRKTYADLPISHGDIVFLTAALSAPDICALEYGRAWDINVTSTSNLISNIISRGGRCIFFSSDTVYGERYDNFDEQSECNPAGEYANMKREVEKRFSGNPSFKAIRLSYVFSAEDRFTRYLVGCEQRSEEAELFHPFYRAVVYRDDIVTGALKLAERWDQISEQFINFGGPQVLSRLEFAEYLREAYLDKLQVKAVEPNADFFKNRPRIISMTSPIFSRLLGRSPHRISEAVCLEFNALSNTKKIL